MLDIDLVESIRRHAGARPHAPAVTAGRDPAGSLSYGELLHRAEGAAAALRDATSQTQSCVLAMSRTPDLVVAMLACLLAERPFAVVDPRRGGWWLASVLQRLAQSVCVVDPGSRELVQRLDPAILAPHVVAVLAPSANGLVAADPQRRAGAGGTGGLGGLGQAAMDGRCAAVLFTSGSTGLPRGVCIGREDLDQRARAEVDWFGLAGDDCILGLLPLSFDVGLAQLLGTLRAGGHHVLIDSWLPGDIAAAIATWSPAGLAASPMVWSTLLGFTDAQAVWDRLRTLRYATLSGGGLPEALLQRLLAQLSPCGLHKTYGLSEMFRIAAASPDVVRRKPASVGSAYTGTAHAILDDHGRRCPAGEIGEIVAWGAGRMLCYLGEPVQRPRPALPGLPAGVDPDLAFHTGDLGFVDADGHLHVVARRDDMVKIMDQRVYPNDAARGIEAILGIEAVYVVAVSDAEGKAVLVAFHDNSVWQGGEAQAVRRLRRSLPPHMVPRRLIGLDVLPVTASGKIAAETLRTKAAIALGLTPGALAEVTPVRTAPEASAGDEP